MCMNIKVVTENMIVRRVPKELKQLVFICHKTKPEIAEATAFLVTALLISDKDIEAGLPAYSIDGTVNIKIEIE